mgnify:CR=1 FL=1
MPDENDNGGLPRTTTPVRVDSPLVAENLQVLLAQLGNQENLPVNEEHVTGLVAYYRWFRWLWLG